MTIEFSRPPHGGRGLKYPPWRSAPPPARRPPHGGRGLKLHDSRTIPTHLQSSPSRGTWIEIKTKVINLSPTVVVPLTGDVD